MTPNEIAASKCPISGTRFENAELADRQRKAESHARLNSGLSASCALDPMIVWAIMVGGREHPCDRCNMDREICRGYPKL